jgi:hypothetical protein
MLLSPSLLTLAGKPPEAAALQDAAYRLEVAMRIGKSPRQFGSIGEAVGSRAL